MLNGEASDESDELLSKMRDESVTSPWDDEVRRDLLHEFETEVATMAAGQRAVGELMMAGLRADGEFPSNKAILNTLNGVCGYGSEIISFIERIQRTLQTSQGESAVNISAAAPKPDGSGWVISLREASARDPQILATNQSQFQFVYIPYSAQGLIGGYISANGTSIKSQGTFTLARAAAGAYTLAIPGRVGTNGVLLLQNASLLAGTTNVADNNFLSYQYNDDGSGTNGVFVIQARQTAAAGAFPLTDTSFCFAWVDFTDPLKPPAPSTAPGPGLTIAQSGGATVITFSSEANGYTLETAAGLNGSISWSTVGIVGQGGLTTSYTVPATPATQFYRLRK